MKGKKGPIPDVMPDDTPEEVQDESLQNEPDDDHDDEGDACHHGVGFDDVCEDCEEEEDEESRAPDIQQHVCSDCSFRGTPEEAMEHGSAMNHTVRVEEPPFVEPQQSALFSEPQQEFTLVLEVPVRKERQEELRARLEDRTRELRKVEAEKKRVDAAFNAEIKEFDSQIDEILSQLRTTHTKAPVSCEWRFDMSTNSKQRYRLDTNEPVHDPEPLSEEDRIRELQRAIAANQQNQAAVAS
jgi:hypothetical protein